MSVERDVRTKKKNRWTQAMLEQLIKLWGTYYQELKTSSREQRNIHIIMIEQLAMVGCTASVEDIRGRMHNLAGKFRKEAVAQLITGRRSQWPYFSKMAKFFEYNPQSKVPKKPRPVLYDMSEYLDMDYAMEDSLDLEGNGRVLIQEGELSEEEHLDYDPEEDDAADGQSDRLEDESYPDEQNILEPIVEVQSTIEDEPDKESSDSDNSVQVEEDMDVVERPPTADRPSSKMARTEKRKNKETTLASEDESPTRALHSKVYQLKSSFRHETIEDFLRILYSNRLYADVSIVTCHNGDICTIPAHRLILANFSPHFSHIFENLNPGAKSESLTLILPQDIPHVVMQILLEYMYTGRTLVQEDMIDDVLRCGTQLKIRGFWSESRGEPIVKHPEENTGDNSIEKAQSGKEAPSQSSTSYRRKRSVRKSTETKPNTDDEYDGALTDVSSNIGLDLLSSDSEDEENRDRNNDSEESEDNNENADDYGDYNDDDDDDDDDYNDDDYYDDYENDDGDDDNDHDDDGNDEKDNNDKDNDNEGDDDKENDVDQENGKDEAINQEDDGGEVEDHCYEKEAIHAQKRMMKTPDRSKVLKVAKLSMDKKMVCWKSETGSLNSTGESESQYVQSSAQDESEIRPVTSLQTSGKNTQKTLEKSLPHTLIDKVSKKSAPSKLIRPYLMTCKLCLQRFPNIDEWLGHVVELHGTDGPRLEKASKDNHITMLQCDLCQKYQESEYYWLKHVLEEHTE